jgi:folate-dependent phosphoribosylglycinamide formyltransferase PurN
MIAAAILMSGTGSNARKLLSLPHPNYDIRVIVSDNPHSNFRRIAEEYGVDFRLNDIYQHYGVPHPREGLSLQQRRRLKDFELREDFDRKTADLLRTYDVTLIAAAGYDWIISESLCREFVIVNVHPGDLRVLDNRGRRKYIGLAWVPTAKAILNGEAAVHSTTHLVTAELDGGPLARVSAPVRIELPEDLSPEAILPDGVQLQDIVRDIGGGGERFGRTLLYTLAKSIQGQLKEIGDWVEFPKTLDAVASLMAAERLVLTEKGLRLDGDPVEDLFLMKGETCG